MVGMEFKDKFLLLETQRGQGAIGPGKDGCRG